MDSTTHETIVCVDVPLSKGIRSFIRKTMERWLRSNAPEALEKGIPVYVHLEKVGPGHDFFCNVKLFLGSQTWSATTSSASLHQSLIHCLNHLRKYRPIPLTLMPHFTSGSSPNYSVA